jgi:hypothetical protein
MCATSNSEYVSCFCFLHLAGGNKNPVKRKAFMDISQTRLEDNLESFVQRIGVEESFDLRAYNHLATSCALDVQSLHKLIPLIRTLLSSTVPKLISYSVL